MDVTRRNLLAAAPAGAALAALLPVGASNEAAVAPPVAVAGEPRGQAGWLVALRSGLAPGGGAA